MVNAEQLANACIPMLSAPCGISTPASILQFWNIPSPIRSIFRGSVTLIRFQHPVNILSPNFTCLLPGVNFALFISVHSINVALPISPMLAGRVIAVRLVQARKTFCPIVSTPSPIVTELRFLHPRKASSPMVFTPEGIVAEMILESLKALLPITVTLEAISTLKAPQFQNALEPILVTPSPITIFWI